MDGEVRFLAHGPGLVMFLVGDGAVITTRSGAGPADGPSGLIQDPSLFEQSRRSPTMARMNPNHVPAEPVTSGSIVRLTVVGINPAATISGSDRLPGAANYIKGRDSSRWVTGVPLI